ncbi:MAG: DUF2325 domain-containing protein [Rhizobium sp.]|nr:MAG: DUF2325 domain-containing protein [Rhizobium sp.]
MSVLLNHKHAPELKIPGLAPVQGSERTPESGPQAKPQRLKTWDLSPMFHCSIVGTCLTTGELRQVLGRIGDIDIKTASDHALHSRGVRAAGQRDIAGKLLNKALDKRHERIVKRFSSISTVEDLRQHWNAAVEEGDISGAYWAIMSHSIRDRGLIQEVFGEVHMLSHIVGSSSRLDLARLRKLQAELERKDEKLAKQESRIQAVSEARNGLLQRVDQLEASLTRAHALAVGARQASAETGRELALVGRLDSAEQRAEELNVRLAAMETKLAEVEKRASRFAEENRVLKRELGLVADLLEPEEGLGSGDAAVAVDGSILYVGGRPSLSGRIRAIGQHRGFDVLFHDGGMEDNLSLLPALVGQAGSIVFPVDCISHSAAGIVKRLCRENGKRYVPLRSASLASFMAAVTEVAAVR